MSSIIRGGDTYHGISVDGRGVFTDKYGIIYAGQHRDGYACGLGVLTYTDGSKNCAEHGPDGEYDGRYLLRYAAGPIFYGLVERGKQKASAWVFANGRCYYNDVDCTSDDPRLLALIAQVAPVEVRPAALAPLPQSPPTRPQAIVRCAGSFAPVGARGRRGSRGAPPRHSPALVAVRHNTTTAALQSTTTQ